MSTPLFDIIVRDSHVLEPVEQRRLAGQNLAILQALQRGPCTNRQLAGLSLKYTSRISDLRRAGYDVKCIEHNRVTGFSRYALVQP